jgi:RimJ/RimL family protein N-acetyltransferase
MTSNDLLYELHLRRAIPSDIDLLFYWANSSDSLRNKFKSPAPIERSVHQKWFSSRLRDSDTRIWIVEKNYEPLGQVRVQLEDGKLSVDIFISSSVRGKGYGTRALILLTKECHLVWPGVPLLAIVKNGNCPSLNLFRRMGFEVKNNDGCVSKLVYTAMNKVMAD